MAYYKKSSTAQFVFLATLNGIILFDDLIAATNSALDGNLSADAAEAAEKIAAFVSGALIWLSPIMERIMGYFA